MSRLSDTTRRRLLSRTLLLVALSMILTATLLASGCCSPAPTSTERPFLPPGKPRSSTAAEIAREIQSAPRSEGSVTLPLSTVRKIFAHLDAWRAWALALEAAGGWRPE